MTYDWLASARHQFLRLSVKLPHALLVQSEPGMGKHQLASEIVASLLCDKPVEVDNALGACGKCKNCVMFKSGNHPDFHYISSERFIDIRDSAHLAYAERYLEPPEKRSKRKPRKIISVDQIRALIDNFHLSNHSSRNKVALIEPADAMNINASNALLKLLEEPSSDSILILVSNDSSRLSMTILSRCIALNVSPPAQEQAKAWLVSQGVSDSKAQKAIAICGTAPLTALAYARSNETDDFEALLEALVAILEQGAGPVEAREALLKLQSPAVLISWLQMLLSWLISAAQQSSRSGSAPWQAYTRLFSRLSRRLDSSMLPVLFQLYDDLSILKKQDLDIVNPGLLLDKWLISFSRVV